MSVHNSGMGKTEAGREPKAKGGESFRKQRGWGSRDQGERDLREGCGIGDKVVTAGLENMLRGGRRGKAARLHRVLHKRGIKNQRHE